MNKTARWVPALAAPVVIIGGALAWPAIASASSPLPDKTPAQVLALVAKSDTAAYSGTVQQTSDLGLPDLSALEKQLGAAGASSNNLLDLLTASHTAKVYTDGGSKQRLQVLDSLAERDVVRSGDSVWLYDSSQSAATHLVFTGGAKKKDASREASAAPEVTPAQLATQLIAQLQPTTGFDVSSSDHVAGRATYRLTLTPKAADSLVADATVAVDAHTGVPLEVSVYAKGQSSPAVQVKFSSIRYGSPAADVFRFSPPKGAKVETQQITPQDLAGARGDAPKLSGAQKPTVIGTGWDAIAELPAGSLDLSQLTQQAAQSGADASAMLNLLQQVDGGRGIQTSLVSVLITDDGRVLAGAVPLTALENAAK